MSSIYYESLFLENNINSLRELISTHGERNIKLVFDTNLCIYLRDIYLNPKDAKKRLSHIWADLEEFIFLVSNYQIEYNHLFGIDESCRNKSDFSLIKEKALQSSIAIESILSYNYDEFQNYLRQEKVIEPYKDKTSLSENKINNYKSKTMFKYQLLGNYPYLLYLYKLNQCTEKPQITKAIEALDYLDNVIDVVSLDLIKFTYYYFGNNKSIKKLLHPKNKKWAIVLQGVWNAAIDLSISHLSNQEIRTTNKIPVFVTFDESLSSLCKGNKMKVMFDDGGNSVIPPAVEMNLEEPAEWSVEEQELLMRRIDVLIEKSFEPLRMLNFDMNKFQKKMINEIKKLEVE